MIVNHEFLEDMQQWVCLVCGYNMIGERHWCINKAASAPPLSPFSSGNSMPYPNRYRHAQIGHDVHGSDARMNFNDLGFKKPRGQVITKQLFESIHGVFGQTPLVVARFVFPGRQAFGFKFARAHRFEDDRLPRPRRFSRGGTTSFASRCFETS